MKRLEVTPHQFKVLVAVLFSLTVIFFAFGLPEVLPLFGVKKAFADFSSVAVCGICYAIAKLWPSFIEYQLPELLRAALRRCGCEVVHTKKMNEI